MFAIVKKTKIGAFEVSTCEVGDYIETMVFNDVTGESDCWSPDFTRRHKSRAQAVSWHDHVVSVMADKFALGA